MSRQSRRRPNPGKGFSMFVLSSASGRVYTGKAGDAWLSAVAGDAFVYGSAVEAERKAAMFNRSTCLHGETFTVKDAAQ